MRTRPAACTAAALPDAAAATHGPYNVSMAYMHTAVCMPRPEGTHNIIHVLKLCLQFLLFFKKVLF